MASRFKSLVGKIPFVKSDEPQPAPATAAPEPAPAAVAPEPAPVKKAAPAKAAKAAPAKKAAPATAGEATATPVKKAAPAAKKTAAKKAAPAPVSEPSAAVEPVKKAAPAVKKTAAKKAAPATAGEPSAPIEPVKKAAPAAKKTVVKKAAPAKAAAVKKVAAKKVAAPEGGAAPDAEGDPAGQPPVKPGEDPWSEAELAELRAELHNERQRLTDEIVAANDQLTEMMRDGSDGSGDDQADAGSRTFEREQELSLAANAEEMRDQVDRALKRLDDGSYGLCENCGGPIGKMRLQAFPRATLCLKCKEKQERR